MMAWVARPRMGIKSLRMPSLSPERRAVYNSSAWQKTRRVIRERDGECAECGQKENLTVHHVIDLEDGGRPLDPTNLVTLCRPCHGRTDARKTRSEVVLHAETLALIEPILSPRHRAERRRVAEERRQALVEQNRRGRSARERTRRMRQAVGEAIQLRTEGRKWREIADLLGFPSASAAAGAVAYHVPDYDRVGHSYMHLRRSSA